MSANSQSQQHDALGNRLCEHGLIFDECRPCTKYEQEMADRRETLAEYRRARGE